MLNFCFRNDDKKLLIDRHEVMIELHRGKNCSQKLRTGRFLPTEWWLGQGEGRRIKSFFILTYDLSFFSTLAESVLQKSKKNERRLGQGGLGPLLKSISSLQFLYWSLIKHHSDNKNNQTRSISISVFAVSNNETRSTSTSRPFCSMLFGGRRTKSIVYS